MLEAVDFGIYQRGKDNTATVCVKGVLPGTEGPDGAICRVVREDDQTGVTAWTPCVMDGRSYYAELTLPAGGLYRIEVTRWDGSANRSWNERIRNIQHVGVGEVYLVTGQSNMAGYGRDAAYDPPQLGVHLFGNNGKWQIAAHPMNDSIDTIFPENRETTSGTSPLLAFGRTMSRKLGVPVGLVQASLGGSPLRDWHPEEDGRLYRAMMRRIPMTGPVGGVVWYQGCSDTDTDETAEAYLPRFVRMIELWRRELGDIPVVTVQLNRHIHTVEGKDRRWGLVREAQRRAAQVIPRLYVVPSTDLGMSDGIHNSSGANVILGERMANALLAAEYGQPSLTAPDLARAVRRGERQVELIFRDTLQSGFFLPNGDVLPLGMDAEDGEGLIPAVKIEECGMAGLLVTFARPLGEGARFHAYWTSNPPFCTARGLNGIPMLSCYGVPVEEA